MDDEKKVFQEMADAEIVELSDDVLDSIAGGYVYHDAGDSAAHRQEAYYVVDDAGKIVMRLDDVGVAKHWAGNLRTSQRLISADEFEQLRRTGKLS